MALLQNDYAKGIKAIPYPDNAATVVGHRFTAAIPATGDGTALNDIIEMAQIPAGCRVLDMILDSTDLDTGGPTITLDVGIMSGDWGDPDPARTCGAEFFAASTVAQAGTAARPTLATAFRTGVATNHRSIGVKIAAAATAKAAGTIGLTVYLTAY